MKKAIYNCETFDYEEIELTEIEIEKIEQLKIQEEKNIVENQKKQRKKELILLMTEANALRDDVAWSNYKAEYDTL